MVVKDALIHTYPLTNTHIHTCAKNISKMYDLGPCLSHKKHSVTFLLLPFPHLKCKIKKYLTKKKENIFTISDGFSPQISIMTIKKQNNFWPYI